MKLRTAALMAAAILAAGPALADPPPWAPAHGRRDKHGQAATVQRAPVYVPPPVLANHFCNRDLASALIGAVAGSAALRGVVGRAMDAADQACIGQVLEHAPDRRTVDLRSPGRGEHRVEPIRSHVRDGRQCRDYTTHAMLEGRRQSSIETACRESDGRWMPR